MYILISKTCTGQKFLKKSLGSSKQPRENQISEFVKILKIHRKCDLTIMIYVGFDEVLLKNSNYL